MSLFYGATNAMGGLEFFTMLKSVKGLESKLEFNPREFKLMGLMNFLPEQLQKRYLVGKLAYLLGFKCKKRA